MNICPFAIWEPGPPENVYGGVAPADGVVMHSVEGYFSDAYRPPQTMRERGVSWPFTVEQDGAIFQHYSLDAQCWHAGNTEANRRKVGIEHEGVKGEPLTPLQLAASVRLTRWIAEQGKWEIERGKTLLAHNEVNPRTTCPNGRIPWDNYEEVAMLRQLTIDEAKVLAEDLKHYGYMVNDPAEQDGYHAQAATPPDGVTRRWVIDVKE